MHCKSLDRSNLCAGGVSTASPALSPASTVPGTDEQARAMAAASVQALGGATPEEKVNPSLTPRPLLSKGIQSVEVFQQEEVTPAPPTKAAQPQPKQLKKKKNNNSKSKKSARSKGQKKKKTIKKPTIKKKQNEKTHELNQTSPHLPADPKPADPKPAVAAAAPPPCVKQEQVKQELHDSPPAVANAIPAQIPIPPRLLASPAPESVHQLLNRAQTSDHFDITDMQKMVAETVKAALPSHKNDHLSSRSAPDHHQPKVRVRNKEAHARRMRFYRSLESNLHLLNILPI